MFDTLNSGDKVANVQTWSLWCCPCGPLLSHICTFLVLCTMSCFKSLPTVDSSQNDPISRYHYYYIIIIFVQLYPTLCDPINCSTPGFPVLHYLPEFAQTHVHWVSDAIQLAHPLPPHLLLPSIFPSIRVFSNELALHISDQSIGASALSSVLSMSIQDRFPLELTGLVSLQSKGLSRVFSSTTIWKHQFFSTQPSLRSNSHIHTWLLEKP